MEALCQSGGLSPATVAGVLVGVVVICSVVAGLVAYRIGFMLAVKKLKAFKAIHEATKHMDIGRLTQDAKAEKKAGKDNKKGTEAKSVNASFDGRFSSMEAGGSSSMNIGMGSGSRSGFMSSFGVTSREERAPGSSSSIFGSMKLGKSKKRRQEEARKRNAEDQLKAAMMAGSIDDLKNAMSLAARDGASTALVEASGILLDRLVAGFLGFDLRPSEQPFHVKKDLPLSQKMGTSQAPHQVMNNATMPGYVPGPSSPGPELSASHEDVKLRGFIQKASNEGLQAEESELSLLVKKDNGRSEYEEVAWLSVPKAGGGVKFFNYATKKARDSHTGKLSRDFHFKPEARLRMAEEAIVALLEEVDELKAKAEAASTQVQLLRDELKANTRNRWYANHRQRWHNDPATTLQIDWGQMAGIVAKSCTDIISRESGELSHGGRIERLADAIRVCQKVCEKLNTGLGFAAYVAYTGIMQSEQLTYEAAASDGPAKMLGKVLPASKCHHTYLAKTGAELVHIADVKSDDKIFFWRGFSTATGAFVAVPIIAPSWKRVIAVLVIDTLHRAPVKSVSTVELEALEAVATSLGVILEEAEGCERAAIRQSMHSTAELLDKKAASHLERSAKSIALACSMQAVEQLMRSPQAAKQLEAAVLELEGLENPSDHVLAVCSALLVVIDYGVIIRDMEAREWILPTDYTELLQLWHDVVLKGMVEIAPNVLMVFDHLTPNDISVANCLRFERAEAMLAKVKAADLDNVPVLVQLLFQWLISAQESNNLAVMARESEVMAHQFGDPSPAGERRPGQVTADILCDIICKRFA